MSELDFRHREADVTEPAGDVTKEQSATPNNQQGVPRAEKSIFRRIADSRAARPIAALLGLSIAGGAVGAVATRGSEGSLKAPDAIIVPAATIPLTPDQVVAQANQGTRAEAAVAALEEAKKPAMTEAEKRQKVTAILEAEAPELLPLLENGSLPYYEENTQFGKPFRMISFVEANAMPGVGDLNRRLGESLNEHFFDLGINGIPLEHFHGEDGKLDQRKSDDIQKVLRGVNDKTVIILPEGAKWPWGQEESRRQEPMFTANLKYPVENGRAVGTFMFHPDGVKVSSLYARHHVTGEAVNAGGGGG